MLKRCLIALCMSAGFAIFLMMGAYLFLRYYDFGSDAHIVAVIDTGVKGNHPLLEGKVLPGFSFVDHSDNTDDHTGHGTHVAGIIAEQSPKSKILPIKVFETDRSQTVELVLPLIYSIIKGADVINMSFGGTGYEMTEDWVIQLAKKKGIIIVASAGNDGEEKLKYPAKYEGVLAIGNIDYRNRLHETSNYGEGMIYAAPGVNIKSAGIQKVEEKKTGTSMSAGYVSGFISYLQSEENIWGEEDIKKELQLAANEAGENVIVQVIDKEKHEAKQKNQLYAWVSSPPPYTKEDKLTFQIHTLNASEVKVIYDVKHEVLHQKGDVNQSLTVPIDEGKHRFVFITKKDEKTNTKYVDITVDRQSPIIKTQKFTFKENYALVEVNDQSLVKVIIKDRYDKEEVHIPRRDQDEFFTLVDMKDAPFLITAIDYLGHETSTTLK